ncbi:hypothetical protein [Paracoccus sulfuroxidans]|uniref:Uncharacterized protein n=1 Tax=Paracoccus sulfuroxidans TaxID=384678 RepID=A0A562NXQ0_9RHOB|nr:hypothetical protein [Paracoccus sulfuroxidans]TWI36780.1 hypothetical protein IQ24_00563 [Paracoccus sulfuroxidans]
MAVWLETDESMDVLVSLRELAFQIPRAELDPHCWKWALLALSCAVNSALICLLSGTAGIGALREDIAEQKLEAHANPVSTKMPKRFGVEPIHVLLDLASGKRNRRERAGGVIAVSPEQREAFDIVVGLRNQFVHFTSTWWYVELDGLPGRMTSVVEIIQAVLADPWSLRHRDDAERDEATALCDSILCKLTEVKALPH